MYVGIQPHLFVNERHTIYFGLTSIMFQAQIVEGNYRSRKLDDKNFYSLVSTVVLMIGMCHLLYSIGSVIKSYKVGVLLLLF